ncbi:MAG: hypothetical protein NTU79_13725 [Planctomycetota bacterium]|nr:hypothetical protein [Planctomycetota bacterium]
MKVISLTLASLLVLVQPLAAQDKEKKKASPKVAKSDSAYTAGVPKPTLAKIRYGNHERQILDFWKAESSTTTPLVFVIHGGDGRVEKRSEWIDSSTPRCSKCETRHAN